MIEQLISKVAVIENTLHEKDDTIQVLIEKVKLLEERQDKIENESHEVNESEQTFLNTSECNETPIETNSEVHRKNIEKPILKPIEN